MKKVVYVTNMTASGIRLPDLSGYTITGTVNMSELFQFTRLVESEDLQNQVNLGNLMVNDGTKDLTASGTDIFLSYEDADYMQGIEIADPFPVPISGGYTIRYEADKFRFDYDTYSFTDLANVYVTEDNKYYVVGEDGVPIFAISAFFQLEDTPATYSGTVGSYLRTTASGIEFVTLSGVYPAVHKDDVLVSPAVTDFNFEGDVSVVEETPGYVTITVASGTGGAMETVADANSEAESSTTSTAFQQKLRLTTGSIPAGNYIVMWYYEWRYKHGSFEFKARVQIDDTTTLMEHQEEPTKVTSWAPSSGFKRVSLTAGSHDIDLDYCSSKSGKEAAIRRARLELWRV